MQENISSSARIPIETQVSTGVLALCFIIGIPGNIAVVVMILRNFKKDNFTLRLMLNLAASDFLCLSTLPWLIYNWITDWQMTHSVCKLLVVMVYTSVFSSVMTVTLMSVHRYFAVLHPHLWNKLGRRGEMVLILSLWILACILSSPTLVTFVVKVKHGKYECDPQFSSDGQRAGIRFCETLFGFVMPFSILVVYYSSLQKKVNETAFFTSKRLTKLVRNIIVTFFVLWIPYHVMNIVDILAISLKSAHPDASANLTDFYNSAEEIVISFTFINSSVNPFLYAFASKSLLHNRDEDTGVPDNGL
ncbi:leukotriene B4 receptor 1-like [Engraulis encrasicolus]|uniref:leukotriene B4 receptor 1-like n=1 Tax=Engraulis encrasicolus TaxID=184585 RepID=UPI002FD69D0C